MKHIVIEKTNPGHGLHLFLSIITGGLWIPVWMLISLCYSFKRANLHHQASREQTQALPEQAGDRAFRNVVSALLLVILFLLGVIGMAAEHRKAQAGTSQALTRPNP
jgi:TRAP-type C4-dicarboxylate transport system permease large subunit